jgi:Escherichia/Staphylococcus phage prohead protease
MAAKKTPDPARSVEFELRSSEMWEDVRFQIEPEGSGFTMDGPLALFDTPSRLLSIADLGSPYARSQLERFGQRRFREIIHPGAFSKSLGENPDIVLHYQHDERSLPLGRTKAGTLKLTEETGMVRARAELPDNEWGRPVRDAIRRGDIGGISFRMGSVIERWSNDSLPDGYKGPIHHLHEVRLKREVSLVTFPGYETPASVRALAEEADVEPDELAEAFAVLRDPEGKLNDKQHSTLQTVIAAKVDAPFLDPKMVQMRERLDAIAAG